MDFFLEGAILILEANKVDNVIIICVRKDEWIGGSKETSDGFRKFLLKPKGIKPSAVCVGFSVEIVLEG